MAKQAVAFVQAPALSVRCLEDWVIVKPTKDTDITAGGIYIPESAQQPDLLREATVVEVGPGRMMDNGDIFPIDREIIGQRVLYRRRQSVNFERDKVKYAAVKIEDVVCAI